ncbi:MAG TPA: hypothetical protein DC057_01565 [Spirochaetia bacterium]|nr:hypothetical protein [Spirochaetia bacterium]
MKISFLIPTKDGGDGFSKLAESIKSNINYANRNGLYFEYEVILIINGDPQKPEKYINSDENVRNFFQIEKINLLGKMVSVNYLLAKTTSDIIIILDDDVYFGEKLLFFALTELLINQDLRLVAFQNRALPYDGKNIINTFFYDIINIRSLKSLYMGIDPFLFGRFLVCKREALTVPNEIINEDLYLSLINDGHFLILPEEVFYVGEHSLLKHIKRVLRLEAGRDQLKKIFPESYEKLLNKNGRKIDQQKIKSIDLYHKMCYSFTRYYDLSLIQLL